MSSVYYEVKARLEVCQGVSANEFDRDYHDRVLNEFATTVQKRIRKGWTVVRNPSSVTVASPKRKTVYRINSGGEIIHDIELGVLNFKSFKHKREGTAAGCEHALTLLEQHFQPQEVEVEH